MKTSIFKTRSRCWQFISSWLMTKNSIEFTAKTWLIVYRPSLLFSTHEIHHKQRTHKDGDVVPLTESRKRFHKCCNQSCDCKSWQELQHSRLEPSKHVEHVNVEHRESHGQEEEAEWSKERLLIVPRKFLLSINWTEKTSKSISNAEKHEGSDSKRRSTPIENRTQHEDDSIEERTEKKFCSVSRSWHGTKSDFIVDDSKSNQCKFRNNGKWNGCSEVTSIVWILRIKIPT